MLTQKERELLGKILSKQKLQGLTPKQAEEVAQQAKVSLKAVEYFALEKGYLPRRYHCNIGTLGVCGQRKLLEKKVIISGLGGLGGYVLEQLGRVGVGRIVGVDPDVFEETNLNRQLLAEEGNLGNKKIDEAEKRLGKINRAVEFVGSATPIDKLPQEVFGGANVVFDCLDNVADRMRLAKRCSTEDVPLVHGAVAGWYGQVAVVCPGSGLLEKIYQHHARSIEQDLGTPPFTATVAAGLMVAAGVQILIGDSFAKEMKMLFFDLSENEWETIAFK